MRAGDLLRVHAMWNAMDQDRQVDILNTIIPLPRGPNLAKMIKMTTAASDPYLSRGKVRQRKLPLHKIAMVCAELGMAIEEFFQVGQG